MPRPRKTNAALGYECGPRLAPTPPPPTPKAPRPKRPSEVLRRLPPLTDDQAAALAALSGDSVYATVAGCKVLKVTSKNPLDVDALRALEEKGFLEKVVLVVYERRSM
jgi:hypothetical protein